MDWTASHVFREKTPYELADPAYRGPLGPSQTCHQQSPAPRTIGAFVSEITAERDAAVPSSPAAAARRRRCSTQIAAAGHIERAAARGGHRLRFLAQPHGRAHQRSSCTTRRQHREDAVDRRGIRAGGRKAAGVGGSPMSTSGARRRAPHPAPRSRSRAWPRAWKRRKIIAALMGAEREPVTHLNDEQAKLAGRAVAAAKHPEQPSAAHLRRLGIQPALAV